MVRLKLFTHLQKLIVILAACTLIACQDAEVAHELNQRQVNEIITVLAEQGIPAKAIKGVGSRSQFVVRVPATQYSEAVSILHYEGLPKIEEPSLSDLLSPKGFLPNSRELEGMRIERALATELEEMLKANPAISEAKATIRRPNFEGVGPQPAVHVSLIIRKFPERQLDRDTIVGLITNMVPGVSVGSVVTDIQDAMPLASDLRKGIERSGSNGKIVSVPMKEFLGWWRVAENDYDRMILVLLISVLGFLLLGLFVGFSLGFLGRKVVSSRSTENLMTIKSDRSTLTLNSPD